MINWPAFYYGFKLLGIAALGVILSLLAELGEYERQHIIRGLMFNFFVIFIINVVVDAVRKQLPSPIKEVLEPEEEPDETQSD